MCCSHLNLSKIFPPQMVARAIFTMKTDIFPRPSLKRTNPYSIMNTENTCQPLSVGLQEQYELNFFSSKRDAWFNFQRVKFNVRDDHLQRHSPVALASTVSKTCILHEAIVTLLCGHCGVIHSSHFNTSLQNLCDGNTWLLVANRHVTRYSRVIGRQ